MLETFFLLLSIVVIVGALVMRGRVRRRVRGDDPMTDDPVLRDILSGSDAHDEDAEPLDEDRIREEEDRFWEQEWDDPDEWRG